MKLRREHSVLLNGDYKDLFADDESIFAYTRENEEEKVVVLLIFTGEMVNYDEASVGIGKVLLSNYGDFEPGCLRPFEGSCLTIEK